MIYRKGVPLARSFPPSMPPPLSSTASAPTSSFSNLPKCKSAPSRWLLVVGSGCWCLLVAVSSLVWLFVAVGNFVWLFVAVGNFVWLLVAVNSLVWLLVAVWSLVWLLVVMGGYCVVVINPVLLLSLKVGKP